MSERPRILDLYSGAGGSAMGYHRAGFDVVGVDIADQPHYPFEFFQEDALGVLKTFEEYGLWGMPNYPDAPLTFDAIHASPPCQAFTHMSNRHRFTPGTVANSRVDLLTPSLALLRGLDIPWVVENVVGSAPPLSPTLKLHGGMFGLGVHRPRLFESNVMILAPVERQAVGVVGVYGRDHDGRRLTRSKSGLRAANSLEEAQEAMGMDWADWHGTKEAIPPAYTEFIGTQLMAHIKAKSESADLGER